MAWRSDLRRCPTRSGNVSAWGGGGARLSGSILGIRQVVFMAPTRSGGCSKGVGNRDGRGWRWAITHPRRELYWGIDYIAQALFAPPLRGDPISLVGVLPCPLHAALVGLLVTVGLGGQTMGRCWPIMVLTS